MSEQNESRTLDDLFGNDDLDLCADTPDYDPFAQGDAPQEWENATPNITPFPIDAEENGADTVEDTQIQPETSTSVLPMKAPAKLSNVAAPDFNPLAAAMNKAEEQNVKAGAAGVLSKPPVFTYGSAKEDIADKTLTFEQLRIAKSEDFPELDDGKRVSWTIEYGTITKQIPKPKETVIHKLKEEIEASKEFFEMLKKQKDKKTPLSARSSPASLPRARAYFRTTKGFYQLGGSAAVR